MVEQDQQPSEGVLPDLFCCLDFLAEHLAAEILHF